MAEKIPLLYSQYSSRNETVHMMRGIAAVTVAISHLVFMSLGAMGLVQGFLGVEQSDPLISSPGLFQISLVLGQLGVGIFFVISGYVIPGALIRAEGSWRGRGTFMLARLVRLWPTYAFSFCMGVLILYKLSSGSPLFGWVDLAGHMALGMRDLLGTKNVDGIVWTLEIEMKFYLLSAIFFPAQISKIPVYVGVLSVVTMLVTHFVTNSVANPVLWVDNLMQFLNVLILMQIGTAAWMWERGIISRNFFFVMLLIVVVCFAFATRPGDWSVGDTLQVKTIYLTGALVFLSFYQRKPRIKHLFKRFLIWLGLISYPLYAVHPILGYAAVYGLVTVGMPIWVSIFLACVIVVFAAQFISIFVEHPSILLSRRLRWVDRQSPTSRKIDNFNSSG